MERIFPLALKFAYDSARKRLHLTATERFTFQDFRTVWAPFRANNTFTDCGSTLWDLSVLDATDVLESDLNEAVEHLLNPHEANPIPMNVALVVPPRAAAGMARTYLGVLMEDQDHFSVFLTLESALGWLDQRGQEEKDKAEG